MELVDAHVSYTPTEGGDELSSSTFVKLEASGDVGRLKDAAVVEVEHAMTTVRVNELDREVGRARARRGYLPNARKLLDASLRLARDGEKKYGDKALGERVVEMTKLRRTLASPRASPGEIGQRPDDARSPAPLRTGARAMAPADCDGASCRTRGAMKELQGL